LFIVPDGEIQPRLYKAGDEATPANVERAARKRGILNEGYAQPEPADASQPVKRKRGRPPKVKAMAAPENK
jgi:hypothetical protein